MTMWPHGLYAYKVRRSILISYGAVAATMMLLCVAFDSLLSDSSEIWYANISYMVITSVVIFVTGMVLLKAFDDMQWFVVALGTSLAVWPMLALLQFGAVPILSMFMLNANLIYAIFVAVFAAITSVPLLVSFIAIKIMRIKLVEA